MRDILKTEELDIPQGVEVTIKARLITVTGPRGTLTKNVAHVNMDIQVVKGKTSKVSLAVWQGGRKHVACLNTIRSLINNMIIGVTKVLRSHGMKYAVSTAFIGFPVQDARSLRTFPYQLYYSERWKFTRNPKFLGRKGKVAHCRYGNIVNNYLADCPTCGHAQRRQSHRVQNAKRRTDFGG